MSFLVQTRIIFLFVIYVWVICVQANLVCTYCYWMNLIISLALQDKTVDSPAHTDPAPPPPHPHPHA